MAKKGLSSSKMETASQNARASGEKKGKGKGKRPIQPKKERLKVTKKVLKSDKAPELPRLIMTEWEPGERDEATARPKVTKEVLESDEALWDLYEKWCCQCKPERTLEDKQMRFKYFKKNAFWIHETNQKEPGMVGLTCWADITDEERENLRCCFLGCSHTYKERQRRLKMIRSGRTKGLARRCR